MRGLALALLSLLVAAPALAQDGEDDLDIGMPTDEEPTDDGTPDEGTPTDEEPSDDTPVRDPAAAKKLAEGAAKFVKKGDKLKKRKKLDEANAEYARAIMAYEKSFEMNPVASILLAAANLHARLEHWMEAADRYKRALAETEIPLDDKARAKAEAGLGDVMMNLGLVTLNVVPEGATVTLDGAEVGVTPLAEPLVLAPGEHTLQLKAEEYIDFETKLVIEAGSESDRSFELQPVPVVVEKPRPPPPPPPPPLPPGPNKLPLIAGAGAAGLFTIGAVITGILAVGEHGTFTDPNATQEERDAAQSSGRTLAALTDAFTGAAVLAAGFTAYYYLKIYKPKADEHDNLERERAGMHDEMGWQVVPSVGRDSAGLVLSGSF